MLNMDEPKRVIIDTDVGTDDAVAILLFLYAEKLKKVKIEAFVCTGGNTTLDNVCKNVVRLLEVAGRTDIPVFKGSHTPILPTNYKFTFFHGVDGFGDLQYENEPDLSVIRKDHAAVALQDIVSNNPKQITLICLGPLTNLALSMRLYQDFAENVKEICIMGGNYTGVGNITAAAEFNFFYDPEAAHIVFECAACPILLLPWECCKYTNILFEWRFNVLGKLGGTVWNLVDRAERSCYKNSDNKSNWMPCDSFLAAAYLFPEVIKKQVETHVSVEIHGVKTRGQVVVDHLEENKNNVVIVQSVNEEVFKEILLQVCANT